MKLLVLKNGTTIEELELQSGGVYIVGRKEGCDIKLDSIPGISREHFKVEEDESGLWSIHVISKVTPVQYDGEEHFDLPIDNDLTFSLLDYRFQFVSEGTEDSVGLEAVAQDEFSDEIPETDEDVDQALENVSFNDLSEEAADETNDKTFVGNEEKTNIQSFAGTPYVKIIGQNGKKSEFFRLEGNLWVAGRDDSASIYINDPSASQNHFEISRTDKGFFINDLGSAEGTILNGQRLEAHTPSQLKSGDIINIASQSLQFELRDQAFKKKVSNIPLHMYQNPLVFFDQETAMVSSEPEIFTAGSVEEVAFEEEVKKVTRKNVLLIATAIVVVIAVIVNFMGTEPTGPAKVAITADPFSKLDDSQKKIVVQTHKLAKQLYLNGNFELALVQLQKLHSIIPSYKDSQEIEKYCISSRDLKREQALREQQRREQEYLEQQVASFIAQCRQRFSKSYDLDGAKACLAPAMNMDPNNPEISQIFADITARQEERKIRLKVAKERADKVRRGKELYARARQYHKKQNFLKAIEAYENHIHSGLPDPSKLVKDSKRKLSSIEYMIKTKKNNLMSDAQGLYKSAQLKEAVRLARQAQKVDPYDHTISKFLNDAEKELTSKVKSIYMDSVIEERFGNLEASRIKWEEIMRIDIETGTYYKKAQRKMKQYGYKH